MDSGYEQEQLGEGRVRFTVHPAPIPAAGGLPIGVAALVGAVILGLTLVPGYGWPVRLPVGLALSGFAARRVYAMTRRQLAFRLDRRRSPGGRFVVSPRAIETPAGRLLLREHVGRLVLRNGAPEHTQASRVSYIVCAENGEDCTTLGGGMTEATARGLLVDVGRILRFRTPPRWGRD